jgi:membrane associated rhomboid family serine protease
MSYFQFYQPFTGVVRHLVIINVLAYIGSYVLLGPEHYNAVTGEMEDPGRLILAVFQPGSEYWHPYQIATHMFMHGSIGHILFNMLTLYFFGSTVEMVWGPQRFLTFYLLCGIGAWLMHMGVQYYELQSIGIDPASFQGCMLGASGAVFGVMTAFAYLFPNQIISLMFPPISLKAKYFVPIMAGLELVYGVSGYSQGIARFAHLGGALTGFIIIMIWYKGRFRNMY